MERIDELVAEIHSLCSQIVAEMKTTNKTWTAHESSPLRYTDGLIVKDSRHDR